MNCSENEMEEDESEWRNSFVDSAALCSAASAANSGPDTKKTPGPAHRVILHFDLDCFYAQVEMIRNPALRSVCLGIQQKYIVVTCNYVARERGVSKLMSVADAKKKCPELVLVKGEDLTHYREMYYKVTELLMSYCPLVERLGFDENFVDVTEVVERRLAQTTDFDSLSFKGHSLSFKGHVYNHFSADVKASDHQRLAVGSHVAAELREAIHSKLGLTGCAGIATNKLLAKLVSGTFKPNQQTILLQENITDIMGCLRGLQKIPGVGHQTAKRLQALGLVNVNELQLYPLNDLEREFGGPTAQRLKNLALGVDDSPVTPTGAPQSLSDEDSFKKMSSVPEVLEKIQELLSSLVERMHKDGRLPRTFRLTIRRFSATNKWFSRESRQCPIPSHIGQKITTSGMHEEAVVQLILLAMKLFHKMVDSSAAFHLTLINTCFSNLQGRGAGGGRAGAITSFFTQNSPRKFHILSSQSQDDSSQNEDSRCLDHQADAHSTIASLKSTKSSSCSEEFICEQSSVVVEEERRKASCSTEGLLYDDMTNTTTHQCPLNVDPEVFKMLPEEIQKELLPPPYLNSPSSQSSSCSATDPPQISQNQPSELSTDSQHVKNTKEAGNRFNTSDRRTTVTKLWPAGATRIQNIVEGDKLSLLPSSSGCKFLGNVDPEVFSELPPDVQRELMSEWKQPRPKMNIPSSRKPGRNWMSKDRKAAGKSSQSNNLLKYFKPT